jgi:hypothetical protein
MGDFIQEESFKDDAARTEFPSLSVEQAGDENAPCSALLHASLEYRSGSSTA